MISHLQVLDHFQRSRKAPSAKLKTSLLQSTSSLYLCARIKITLHQTSPWRDHPHQSGWKAWTSDQARKQTWALQHSRKIPLITLIGTALETHMRDQNLKSKELQSSMAPRVTLSRASKVRSYRFHLKITSIKSWSPMRPNWSISLHPL